MSAMISFADRFFDAVASGDIETVGSFYRDDVTVWHNYDLIDQTKADNLATLGSIPERYESFGYADARTIEVDGGFLRQHVIHAGRNGKKAIAPAILRVYVEDEKISRIEEYFDRGQLMNALA